MALPTSLDIYQAGSALLTLAVDVQSQLPRQFRTGLGNRITDECVELLVLIARANAARDPALRAAHIEGLLERLAVAVFLLRVCGEKRHISRMLWANSIVLTDNVGKQANGWLKSARGRVSCVSAAPAA